MEQFGAVKRSKDGQPVRYLIVDDSVFARKNLARMIESFGGLLAGEAGDGLTAITEYDRTKPDIVLMFLDPQNRRNTTWRVLLGCVLGVSLLSARAWLCSMPHTLPGHTLRGDFRHFGNKQCLEHNDATVTPPSAVAMPELVPQFVVFTARSASVAVYSLYGTHYDRPPPS